MRDIIRLRTPLSNDDVCYLQAGDRVLLSGEIYTGRDAAHKRLFDLLQRGEELPVDINGQVIYYVGPTPAKPGHVIGSAGPTTSGRMDLYTPSLVARGLKGMIGKGQRSQQVIDVLKLHKAVYFGATGGAGALLSKHIKSACVVAYEDLGPEAIYLLEVEDLPLIVINDTKGNDLYADAVQKWQRGD